MSEHSDPRRDRDDRDELDEAAEQGPIEAPVGSSATGGFSDAEGSSFEERDDEEGGRA